MEFRCCNHTFVLLRHLTLGLSIICVTELALPALVHSPRCIAADDESKLPPAVDRKVEFARDVEPILRDHCFKCHGPNKQRGELRLDLKSAAMKGGGSFAPAIIPEQSADSPLVQFTAGLVEGMEMPPEGEKRLSSKEIGILRAWIDQGANWPSNEEKLEESKPHWSFTPVKRPAVPAMPAGNTASARDPIDPFILSMLSGQEVTASDGSSTTLQPSAEADRTTLIRRASFDLIGLPPTPDEVAEFASDTSPDAYERLVDRLLASPHFGERWARHWMDVVKFAESDGFETNQPRPNAWHYRDYVIRAFNEDKPFERFVFEQIAGDTVGVDEATGFLVAGAWDRVKSPDPALTAQQRADELHDMVSTTGTAFIGLTIGCARCHNHKFDPISQTDYYSIKAVFEGVQHGERPLRSIEFERNQQTAQKLRTDLTSVEQDLTRYAPVAFVAASSTPPFEQNPLAIISVQQSTLLIDDELDSVELNEPPRVHFVVPRTGIESYQNGTRRGQKGDPGDTSHYPNLGRSYSHWTTAPKTDVFTWNPRVDGRWHLWLSWGCGWDTHAPDATYVLDRDGDLATIGDQQEIVKVDQRRFADGTSGDKNQSLWSGFFDAGIHTLAPTSCLVLRSGDSNAVVTADLICLQRSTDDSDAGLAQPRLRSSVHRQRNVERFSPIKARFVRFVIEATNGGEPCLDELEVFETPQTRTSPARNVALDSFGTRATASSSLPGFDIHQVKFVNDGRYGNSASWISHESGSGWLLLELPEPVEIDRVTWSRDRPDEGRFQDRIPTRYRIEAGLNIDALRVVATSQDRMAYDRKLTSLPTLIGCNPSEQQLARELTTQREALRQQLKRLADIGMAYAGRFVKPEPTYRLHRGDPLQPKEQTPPASLASFGSKWQMPADALESARRTSLAKWIADPSHPLTARVMANRLWHFHFGQGIVSTPSDFGRNGGTPSHPELLDWLAMELVSGDSPKRLHRMIVNSATYRQSSQPRDDAMKLDAGTRLLWRFPPRRLEAEPIRDAILAISGNLDDRMSGPGFDLFEPNTNYVKVYNSKHTFGPAEWRRMVYQSKPRMQLDDIFGQFDCPDAGQITPKRTSSITALQALNLLNSRFVLQQSQLFANRLTAEAGPAPADQVRLAFQLGFQRDPTHEELTAAVELIEPHGLVAFCRAFLNANEFLFVF
ncbi:PSD1 and planctomycete cytochrome C domain-containing protein [Schlesneria paludicola]|uniref:PSD1 and planctomycete cytochrome C domain-containing protein n=1 Tax=Schlesneria paludicola TaxID=360056 RepID=UPI00029AC2C1|nr:PSD1 and planctomycete cytochrome C domain-containing protein [Schlesneria paludicola]